MSAAADRSTEVTEGTVRAAAAARLLWRHWQAGSVLEALPPDIRPANRAEGYAAQRSCRRPPAKR